jgi:hypothetical protein
MLKRAASRAEVCRDPAPARVEVSPGFRYGCFCGGGYPGFRDPSGKKPQQLGRKEREKLVARYYAVEPVDAIDAACRAHDVCYVWKGQPDEACNDAFASTMKELRATFQEEGRERCAGLALDLRLAARAVFPSASFHDKAVKVLRAPLTAVEAMLVGAGALWDGYPHPGERCSPAPGSREPGLSALDP